MNQRVKELWVAALESGDYAQTTGSLHKTGPTVNDEWTAGFCCLGVLCDLYRKEVGGEWRPWSEQNPDLKLFVPRNKDDSDHHYLPRAVQQWAGLDTSRPETSSGEKLDYLNDRGYDFKEIASTIKHNL